MLLGWLVGWLAMGICSLIKFSRLQRPEAREERKERELPFVAQQVPTSFRGLKGSQKRERESETT